MSNDPLLAQRIQAALAGVEQVEMELRRKVEDIGTDELAPGGREAVRELLAELETTAPGERAQLEVLVREAVETLVYGD